tara:strand:- start:2581 stop:3432 length:852 start_codon:yes stop_codon:yes gene_type:complete
MILIDNNQLIIANVFASMKHHNIEDETILRHLVVNTYRNYNSKFKEEYGDMIICHDSAHCWRKEYFPLYKANRKVSKQKSKHDWDKIFNTMTEIRQEIQDNFPWKNVSVPKTEADDIIACIAKNSSPMESVLIVSADKDFQQLQKYSNVKQWSPMKQDYLVCENPEDYLLTHVISGDSSDGVPNILSDDDTFVVEGKRQKACGKKKIQIFKDRYIKENLIDDDVLQNWNRNQKMIDFSGIPDDIQNEIMEEFNKEHTRETKNIFQYLVDNKLIKLLECIEELY